METYIEPKNYIIHGIDSKGKVVVEYTKKSYSDFENICNKGLVKNAIAMELISIRKGRLFVRERRYC